MGLLIGIMTLVSAIFGFLFARGRKNYRLVGILVSGGVFLVWATFRGFFYAPVFYVTVVFPVALTFLLTEVDRKLRSAK